MLMAFHRIHCERLPFELNPPALLGGARFYPRTGISLPAEPTASLYTGRSSLVQFGEAKPLRPAPSVLKPHHPGVAVSATHPPRDGPGLGCGVILLGAVSTQVHDENVPAPSRIAKG